MRFTFLALAAAAVFGLSSCTLLGRTEPVPRSAGKPVPPERLLAYTEKKDGYVSFAVTRDAGFMGSGCFIGLVILERSRLASTPKRPPNSSAYKHGSRARS